MHDGADQALAANPANAARQGSDSQTQRGGDKVCSEPQSPNAGGFLWPIVRVRKTYFGKKEIVRIEPTCISFRSTRGDVTDEMLMSNEVGGANGAWTTCPQGTIRAIRSKRVGFITKSSLWQRFEVETDREKHEFRVPDREVANVMYALRKLAGDRLHEQPRRRPSAAEFAMIGFGILAVILTMLGWYHANVATDIVQNVLGKVAPAFGAAVQKQTTYKGHAIPYEFRLGPEWIPERATPQPANVEYAFALRDGIGKLIVTAKAGRPLTDFFATGLPESLRVAIETEVRKIVPGATIKVLGSRWIALNGIQWREIAFEQSYSISASDMKRVLYYSSPSGWTAVTLILPNVSHYQTVADELVATFKAPKSDLDQLLLDSRAGEPTVYQGKKAGYRISLRSIWVPQDIAQKVAGMGAAGKVIKEEIGIEQVEYSFALGDGKFGSMESEIGDEPIDFGNLKEYAKEVTQMMQPALEKVAPGFQIRIEAADPEILTRGSRRWGELRYRVVMSKDSYTADFQNFQRVTNHGGKSLSFSARVQRNHPGVEAIVREALDSISFDE